MGKVYFLHVPAYGHINPTIGVMRELSACGEDVIAYATERFRDKLEGAGATFRPYRNLSIDPDRIPYLSKKVVRMAPILLESTREILPGILEDARADCPDYVIHDCMAPWGWVAGRALDVPTISSTPLFAFTPGAAASSLRFMMGFIVDVLRYVPDVYRFWRLSRRIEREFGVKPPNLAGVFNSVEPLNIVYTSREFQPRSDTMGPEYKFVGPSIAERGDPTDFPLERLEGAETALYLSMGTVNNDRYDIYRKCMRAFGGADGKIVAMAIGRGNPVEPLEPIPDNFIVRNYVPQLDILQRVEVFITHGGMNGVHEGLYYGVPLLVIPQTPEQSFVADRVAAVGAGLRMDNGEITPESLRNAIDVLLRDPAYRRKSAELGETLRAAGGYQRAADEILAYVGASV
jgi:MGT family glycosyltransferase